MISAEWSRRRCENTIENFQKEIPIILEAYRDLCDYKDFYIRPAHRNPGDSAQFDCENSWFRSLGGSYLRGSILAQGDLDIWDITRTIKQSGFDGDIYLEYEGMEECEYGTRLSFENMKRIWNEV